MNIKVLGTGCANCKTLEKSVTNVVSEMGINAKIEKIEDFQQIMNYGIMRTPGLVINEKVVVSGRVPTTSEIKDFIQKHQ